MKVRKLRSHYAASVELIFECKVKDAQKYIEKQNKVDLKWTEDEDASFGIMQKIEDVRRVYYYVYVDTLKATRKEILSTVVHELTHLSFAIMQNNDMPMDKKHDEWFAYMIDDLFLQSYEHIYK